MIRRLITAIGEDGNSVFLEDKYISSINPYPEFPRFSLTDLFYTEQNPQSLDLQEKQQPFQLDMPPGSFRCCVCHIPPMADLLVDFIEYTKQTGGVLPENKEDFMLHKTHSIDYVYVLKGEVFLRLNNNNERLLKQGDFVIQKGAVHSWNNRTLEQCDILGIMVGAT